MGYGQFLRDALSPLGVYDLSPGSFSGGEVEAVGAALDLFWEGAMEGQRQTIVETATEKGLSAWERLLPYRTGQSPQERRAAIGGFLSISGDSFAPENLARCLSACGLRVELTETNQRGVVALGFPDVMGTPPGFSKIRTIIEGILPCHLLVDYRLKFCTWGEAAVLSWGDAEGNTWDWLEKFRL